MMERLTITLLWPPYVIRQLGHYIFCHVVSSIFFYLFSRLISAVADWMSAILVHVVWP